MPTCREGILEWEERAERRHENKQLHVREPRSREKSWNWEEKKVHRYDLIVGVPAGRTSRRYVDGASSEVEHQKRPGRLLQMKNQTNYVC